MKPEDKELLLKDLCARLPYGVKVEHLLHAPNNPSSLFDIDMDKQVLYCVHKGREEWYKVDFVKPYLRPMSSMTEEESNDLESIIFPLMEKDWDGNENPACIRCIDITKYMDFILSHHFDYKGLIEKGLAIEVTKDNNPYSKN